MSERKENWASYSQLASHRSCPQKWHYSSIRRLAKVDPEDVKAEMNFGSWWHMLRAADALGRGRNLGSLKWVPKQLTCVDNGPVLAAAEATPVEVVALAEEWWKTLTPYQQDTYVERLGESVHDRLWSLYEQWLEEWKEEIRTEHPLAVEMMWKRNLPSLPGIQLGLAPGEFVDPETVLLGYVDEVYFDTRRNMVVVRDNKTSKALSTQSTVDDMMDSQLQLYAWGATPTVMEWGKGQIQATAYDRIRTVKAKTPLVTQSGTLAKKITDFGVRTYLEWARSGVEYPGRLKDGSGAGIYEVEPAVIENLSTPRARSIWFQRTLTPLNGNLIRTHLRAAVDSSLDMSLTRARVQLSGEAARNLAGGCRWCDFAGLCRAEMVGGPSGEYDLADFRLKQRD